MTSKKLEFPKEFFWGAASASYQVEGNITNTDWAKAGRDGKVPVSDSGPDHYNRYEEDFDLAKSLGQNSHRLSVEWSRIEPEEGKFDHEAIEHYKKVFQALKDREITPFATIWHFTLPQWLADKGGVESVEFSKYFARYAKFVVCSLHEYCHRWATMNEPGVVASMGWITGEWVPFKKRNFIGCLVVINNLIKAHVEAYKAIKGCDLVTEVGVVHQNVYFHSNGNILNNFIAKIFNKFGNHYFLDRIKNHLDSIGLNYYMDSFFGKRKEVLEKTDMGWVIYPEGIYHLLVGLKKYEKPIFVSEAGIADEADTKRGKYIKDLVYWMYKAISCGVPLKGYMYWSLTDNYEWAYGYKKRFGLIAIDYETKKRTIRQSAYEYKKICDDNALTIVDNS